MKVLVACESSGRVREAFRARGHNAWSCDLEPSEDDSQFHLQFDVLDVLAGNINWGPHTWDLMIAHPPCTYLANSGVHWLMPSKEMKNTPEDFWTSDMRKEAERINQRWKNLELARQFFMILWNAPIPKICIENPVPHRYADLPKYTQTIQPWMFGEDASKRTCLWLKGLPALTPTKLISPTHEGLNGKKVYGNQTPSGQNKLGPSKDRARERSRTYEGIALAFAEQWG